MTALPEVGATAADTPDHVDLATLFDRYGADLLRYCARRVGPDHAEDVVAETFLTAHAHRYRFDPQRGGAAAWLFGIATNLLRRHGRDEVRAYRALARAYGRAIHQAGEEADRADERIDAYRARRRLAEALASLPRRQRDVLMLYAVAELEYAEIATALALPIGTVQSALHRARAKVRAALATNSIKPRGGQQ